MRLMDPISTRTASTPPNRPRAPLQPQGSRSSRSRVLNRRPAGGAILDNRQLLISISLLRVTLQVHITGRTLTTGGRFVGRHLVCR